MKNETRKTLSRAAAAAALAMAIPAAADFSSQGAKAENFGKAEDVGKGLVADDSGKPPASARYRDPSLPVEERIDDLMRYLRPEEKAALLHACSGLSCGRIPRIGLEEFRTLDGPNGPRGEKTVYFPSAIAYAATWNTNLQYRIGTALGEETRGMYPRSKTTARMLLGPGCNIARSPLGARNFEYLGEDPVLSGRTAASLIRGLQSVKVAPCLKHYVLNDQEYCRTILDVDAPERAIREIYMRPFSIAVREADPWAIMNSYNMVRGQYASHSWYINSALFDEGWTGAYLTDWGGYHGDVAAINGGTTVETSCKADPKRDRREIELLKSGKIRKDRFDDAVRRALRLYFRVGAFDFDTPADRAGQALAEKKYLGDEHRKIAYEAAAQSTVLLKNDGAFLPLDFSKIKKVAVIGPNADQLTSMIDGKHLRYRGGSGAVKADRETTPLKAVVDAFGKERVIFAPGCRFEDAKLKTAKSVPGMPALDPLEAAAQADLVLFFGGLDHSLDREVLGWGRIMPADRPDLELKAGTGSDGKKVDQAELLAKVAAANPRTVAIITAGAPVSVERWHEAVKAILVDWYPGGEGNRAVMDILCGKVNPSGKLPYTFGRKLSDWPAHSMGPECFPGVQEPLPGGKGKRWREYYKDGIWVGYRGFDRFGATPRYPFGFGLSYTTFEITPLPPAGATYRVSVRNTGKRAGREVVQFYISKPADAGVEMPKKELIRFASVELAPGEEKEIAFALEDADMRYWDEKAGGWRIAPGRYTVLAGDSSDALKPVMSTSRPGGGADGKPARAAPFTTAGTPWNPDGLGNHRAVVRVAEAGGTARAFLKWRRTDPQPAIKGVVVKCAGSGASAKDVAVRNVTAESGEVFFKPVAGEGEYFIYYMPYRELKGSREGRHHPRWNDYLAASPEKRVVAGERICDAEVLRFESRTAFEAWTPMGLRATAEEVAAVRRSHPENPVVFTEDRANPVHPASWLPAKWAKGVEARNVFSGTALKDEYYVWQIALWTPGGAVGDVKVGFTGLVPDAPGAKAIPASELTCFNTEGTDWDGSRMDIRLDVPAGRVQPLWCGVMIPADAVPGVYRGKATVSGEGFAPREIALEITVADGTARDHGDGEPWRHSRLRWLNSRIGEDDTPTKPYAGMECDPGARRMTASEKTLVVAESGLPASIVAGGREILRRPMRFEVETASGIVQAGAGTFKVTSATGGHVDWLAESRAGGVAFKVEGRMEFDGFVRCAVEAAAEGDVAVKDVRLVAEYTPYASEYMMGAGYMGRDGGKRPKNYTWKWEGPFDSYWTGGAHAGLHVEFRGGAYHGPLIADRSYGYAPPQAWANGGKGRVDFGGEGGMEVVARTGATALSAKPRKWEFAMNVTPVKPVDLKKQFSQRYYHADPAGFDAAAARGANILNIHHAQKLNPVINYPFIVQDELKKYISEQHDKGRKVKLYYTIRELSNHAVELQALRSLGGEIVAPGGAYGAPWLWEHMGEGYRPAWYVRLPGDSGIVDAAFVTSPRSRWINYYLEGLRWMFENYGIDGIYMDDVAFDRSVMKRMRRIIERYRPGALVDLHSNTSYSKGAMNQYAEFFPYVDRLWFGEWFKYDAMSSDSWFVTFSGIPFGQMSEMLQDGGNRWLGAVYGATRRAYGSLADENPFAIWKEWARFGIGESEMCGYWEENPAVAADSPDVKATAFVREGRTLVAIGNFAGKPRETRLSIDWKRLGLDPANAEIVARPIGNFQDGRAFSPGETIRIPAKRGLLLELGPRR